MLRWPDRSQAFIKNKTVKNLFYLSRYHVLWLIMSHTINSTGGVFIWLQLSKWFLMTPVSHEIILKKKNTHKKSVCLITLSAMWFLFNMHLLRTCCASVLLLCSLCNNLSRIINQTDILVSALPQSFLLYSLLIGKSPEQMCVHGKYRQMWAGVRTLNMLLC